MDSHKPDRHTDFDTAEAGWIAVARCLEEFSDAWQRQIENGQIKKSGTLLSADRRENNSVCPPGLAEFLPDATDKWRTVTLIELIKLDMEYRSQGHSPWKPLEEYRDEWPELRTGGKLPADLLYEEFQILNRMGDGVAPEEYEKRFPGERGNLTRLVTAGETETSALYHSRAPSSFDVGDRVDDFDLLTRLGKGAFATVFLARQNSMQRIVALKISANQGSEPQTLAQLDHPHIVRVYDQRIIRNPPARLLYMQNITGGTLGEVVTEARRLAVNEDLSGQHLVKAIDHLLDIRGEPIPVKSGHRRRLARSSWGEVVSQIGNEIAQALSYAHEQGVLHRDLKPANVLLDKDGHVKLVDFNISFCSKVDGASPAAYFGGSLSYMSPEQLEACDPGHDRQPDSLDGRSDIYSTGVMLFEMLVGNRPYVDNLNPDQWSDSIQRMVQERRHGISEESSRKLSSGPVILGKTIARCLDGCTENRFRNGNELATSLAWARNPRSGLLFQKPGHLATRFANRTPFFTVGLLTMGISLAAVLFILTYNLEKAVPAGARTLFQDQLVPWQNLILFAIGGTLIFWMTRPVSRCLREWKNAATISPRIVNRAIERNLRLGHWMAIMSAVEWTVGGALLPLMLVLSGYSMDLKSMFDFVSSHFLAGLITGAYVFWLVSWFSLRVWQPRLLEAALASDAELDWSRHHRWLEKLTGFYHFLAVSVPLTGIAWLVLYEGSTDSGSLNPGTVDKRSLGTLCVVALLGLVLLVWTSRRVKSAIDVQQSFNPHQDEF